jgi:hypothetical protein
VPSVVRAARDTLPALAAAASKAAAPAAWAGLSPRLLATIDWTLALAPQDRPHDVATVRRALLGEIVPPRPSPRFAATPSSADSAVPPARPDTAAQKEPPRPEALPAPVPAPSHRRARPGAALLLAFAGLATVGWGAFDLQGDAPVASTATPRETLALPEAVETPAPRPPAPIATPPPGPAADRVLTVETAPAASEASTAPSLRRDPRARVLGPRRLAAARRRDGAADGRQAGARAEAVGVAVRQHRRARRSRRVPRRQRHVDDGPVHPQSVPRPERAHERAVHRAAAGRGRTPAPDGVGGLSPRHARPCASRATASKAAAAPS